MSECNWRDVCVTADTSIIDVIKVLNKTALKLVLVVDESVILLGVVTDGDIRSGLLKGFCVDDRISQVMNTKPITTIPNNSRQKNLSLMKLHRIQQIPIIDENNCVVGLEIQEELFKKRTPKKTPVVLMAGGLGSRLSHLTKICPKPLLKVGSKPILETIIENFVEYGFSIFFISVNYKAEMIEEYFGDGSNWGISIEYLKEDEAKGTAGSLNLLVERFSVPIFVMNGDLLTTVNLDHLLDFHIQMDATATMCVKVNHHTVPYGVVKINHHEIYSLEEKPKNSYFMNAGIYILNPKVLENVPDKGKFDMTDLFELLLNRQEKIVAFPLIEYWKDIGQHRELQAADEEFGKYFPERI